MLPYSLWPRAIDPDVDPDDYEEDDEEDEEEQDDEEDDDDGDGEKWHVGGFQDPARRPQLTLDFGSRSSYTGVRFISSASPLVPRGEAQGVLFLAWVGLIRLLLSGRGVVCKRAQFLG